MTVIMRAHDERAPRPVLEIQVKRTIAFTSAHKGFRSIVDQIVLTSRKPEVMPRKNSQRSWPEVGFGEVIRRSPTSPFLDLVVDLLPRSRARSITFAWPTIREVAELSGKDHGLFAYDPADEIHDAVRT